MAQVEKTTAVRYVITELTESEMKVLEKVLSEEPLEPDEVEIAVELHETVSAARGIE